MQTSIFTIFNLDLYQKIKFSLSCEVRNETHKEFLSSFLSECLSITVPLRVTGRTVCTKPVSERATDQERGSGRKYEAAKQLFCLPYHFLDPMLYCLQA